MPVDLTDASREALRRAATVAQTSMAELIVLHVVRLNIGGEEIGVPRTRLLNELADAARAKIAAWVADLESAPPVVRIVIAEGQPAREIVGEARDRGADLIVLARRPRAGWRWFVPHTAPRVLRRAPCPVLVVNQPRAGEAR